MTSLHAKPDSATAVVIDAHGRILVAGETGGAFEARTRDFALVRYLPDGTLDPSFGTDGIVTTDFGGRGDSATDVFLQPDGRIVAVGTAVVGRRLGGWQCVDAVAIARYLEDGSPDPSFGSGGRQTALRSHVFCGVRPSAAAPTADGGLVVVANGGCGGESDEPLGGAVVRLTANGQLDSSFGNGGTLYTYRAGSGWATSPCSRTAGSS